MSNNKYKERLTLMETIAKERNIKEEIRRAKRGYETIEERRRREKREWFFNRLYDIGSTIKLIFDVTLMIAKGVIKFFDM